MPFYPSEIRYSDKYVTGSYEYTSVILPKSSLNKIDEKKTMSYEKLKNLGVQISSNWIHYMVHEPEPHVILLRRPICSKESKEKTIGM
mmetsp:Transcript_13808/g.14363  ORF Transcript_13808/g.14363 Transcript_13808/m.14363 type:complete len:88 (-) Transcript_13808:190-453(-)